MADVSARIIKELWNATEESTWASLRSNLDEIYSYDVITISQWEELKYAIDKLEELETAFPDSPGELHQLLDPFM
jgi:hypothetical protein